MGLTLLIARVLLAAVFAVAGAAKLADLKGSRQAMRDFGLPKALATPFGTILPFAELVVAVALVPRASAWWGALGALVLLLAFVAGIGTSLSRGKQPDCHCFGQLHSAPAGWPTLARNGALAAVALFILLQGHDDVGLSVVGWTSELSTAASVVLVIGLLALALLVVEGWVLTHLLSQNGRLLVRLDALEARQGDAAPSPVANRSAAAGLPVGSPAPAFSLSGLHGETMTLDALRAAGKPVMLIFSDPGCGPCNALLPNVATWQRDHAGSMTLALLSRGTPESNHAKSTEHGLAHVLMQEDREVAQAYQAHGTPSAVVVLPDGTIGSPLAGGADAIRALVERTSGAPAPAIPLHVVPGNGGAANGNHAAPAAPAVMARRGEAAPEVRLPDLNGKTVRLQDFRGSSTLVLFWNPGCGFCQRMLDDLKAWEATRAENAPKLLVISTGSAEANRQMGLTSTIVLDEGFTTGRTFGAGGTPSAVLVDAEGKIASDLAVGATAVLSLAGQEGRTLSA